MKYRIFIIIIFTISALLMAGLTLGNKQQSEEPMELHLIMRLIMMHVHTIDEGIYLQNFRLVEEGAADINDHPPLSENSRALVQKTLGDEMPAFGEFDQIVHSRADSIRIAAERHDMEGILKHYRIMQQGCVNCHAAFQNEIREARMGFKK